MFDVVLYQPEIPPNAGNVIRLCANTGCRLHFVGPLGFDLEDRQLRRAGLDYHEYAALAVHTDWASCLGVLTGRRLFAFSTRANRLFTSVRYAPGDVLLFGSETRGLPTEIIDSVGVDQRLRLPMRPGQRSLNLSNAVAVAVFEAWRQCDFEGTR